MAEGTKELTDDLALDMLAVTEGLERGNVRNIPAPGDGVPVRAPARAEDGEGSDGNDGEGLGETAGDDPGPDGRTVQNRDIPVADSGTEDGGEADREDDAQENGSGEEDGKAEEDRKGGAPDGVEKGEPDGDVDPEAAAAAAEYWRRFSMGVERIVGQIFQSEEESRRVFARELESIRVELSHDIKQAARWEIRDTVMEALSGPAEAIAGTGHASTILASVARGEGDVRRRIGEAAGVLGIVQRYLSRDSVMVKGEAMKLEKVLGGEGRIAVRVGAAREMISAAQEELRFVPGEGEPAQRAAQAALARLGTAQMELAAVFGAVGNVDEDMLPHVPGVDRGGIPEPEEVKEARMFRADFYRQYGKDRALVTWVKGGLVAAAIAGAAVLGRMSFYVAEAWDGLAGGLF